MIEGERVCLWALERENIDLNYISWMNDPDVVKFLEIRRPQSRTDLLNYFERHVGKDNEPWFGIGIKNGRPGVHHMLGDPDLPLERNRTFEHIGNIKLGPINWLHRRADISLFIGRKDLWGKGYGTEAIQLVTEYAFNRLNLHKVTAGVCATNLGSKGAFEKAGFRTEGFRYSHLWVDGEYESLILYGLVSDDHKERTAKKKMKKTLSKESERTKA